MILLSLLSAFAFLSVSDAFQSEYTLRIVYNTSSTSGGNTTQTFFIPLGAFSSILANISGDVMSELGPAQAEQLNSVIDRLENSITELVRNPNDREALTEFSNDLLKLLRGLRNSGSEKLNDILLNLLDAFRRPPSNGGNPRDPQDPQTTQDPTSAADRAKVSPLINQLAGLASSLSPFASEGDQMTSNLISDLLSQLQALPNASDIWSAVLRIILTDLSALRNANPALERILNRILGLALSILNGLPSIKLSYNGLPAFLVNILVRLAQQDLIDVDAVLQALDALSGTGRNDLGSIVSALNVLIEGLTRGAPNAIQTLIETLTSQLTQYASGSIQPQTILGTLEQLVQAVRNDPDASGYKSSVGIILNAIGLLFGDMNGIGEFLQKLMARLNMRLETNSSGSCGGLLGGILCTVSQLVGGLLGGGSQENFQQLADTVSSGSLGGALSGAADSVNGLVNGATNGLGNAVDGLTGSGSRGGNLADGGQSGGSGGGGGGLLGVVGGLVNGLLGR